MGFKIVISHSAELDLTEAYSHYATLSFKTLQHFDKELQESFKALEINPFYKLRYKKIRALPVKNFPYLIFFTLDESNRNVEIRGVFNTHQNPEKHL